MLDEATRLELRDVIRRALEPYPDLLGLTTGNTVTPEAIATLFATAGENGWLAVATQEDAGGLGLGMEGAAILATEIGRAAAPGPFLANAVVLPLLARTHVGDRLAGDLPAFAAGRRRATIAVASGFEDDNRLVVEHAHGATDLLVVGDGTAGPDAGRRVRLLPAPPLSALDPFDPASPMAALQEDDIAAAEFDAVLDETAAEELTGAVDLWIAAELIGIAERAGEMAIAHASERRQFGQVIGSYQGVKHRIVDDYVLRQNAAAVLLAATRSWDANGADRLMLSHAARAAASEAALRTTASCVQTHGAMGFSWEHPAHLYYKRARRLSNQLGSTGESLSALGKAICAA